MNAKTITVNLTDPFDNDCIEVYPFADRETAKDPKTQKQFLVDGFTLRCNCDMGHLGDPRMYRAELYEDNGILFHLPKASSHVTKPECIGPGHKRNANVQMNTAANKLLKNEKGQIKYLVIKFPTVKKLTNEDFSPNSVDGTITKSFHPFLTHAQVLGQKIPVWKTEIEWVVTIHETEKRESDIGKNQSSTSADELALQGAFAGTYNFEDI